MTTDPERKRLLQIARDAIVAHVSGEKPPKGEPQALESRLGGAFVTLHTRGELRGCIGHIEANERLEDVVARCAVAACSSDPRFPAVTGPELSDIQIELSLLGPLDRISQPAEIEVGRHGIVVESGWSRGLLLPQVATELGWDAPTFLAQTCRKAGLPLDAWKMPGAKIWRFDAEVFGED